LTTASTYVHGRPPLRRHQSHRPKDHPEVTKSAQLWWVLSTPSVLQLAPPKRSLALCLATEGIAVHHVHARGWRGNKKRSLASGPRQPHWRFTAAYPHARGGWPWSGHPPI